ncbi:uncharacterized protein LOC114009619 [Tupaia chinensis]|uniref:uncharacterized protein LOC114009619 n=1 Tax=Tupaia chinensis TaxID=246437 RepID=UPI000FFC60E0|nr:uncharacterized protein LOC114009619 [Tupaia chinensis]
MPYFTPVHVSRLSRCPGQGARTGQSGSAACAHSRSHSPALPARAAVGVCVHAGPGRRDLLCSPPAALGDQRVELCRRHTLSWRKGGWQGLRAWRWGRRGEGSGGLGRNGLGAAGRVGLGPRKVLPGTGSRPCAGLLQTVGLRGRPHPGDLAAGAQSTSRGRPGAHAASACSGRDGRVRPGRGRGQTTFAVRPSPLQPSALTPRVGRTRLICSDLEGLQAGATWTHRGDLVTLSFNILRGLPFGRGGGSTSSSSGALFPSPYCSLPEFSCLSPQPSLPSPPGQEPPWVAGTVPFLFLCFSAGQQDGVDVD